MPYLRRPLILSLLLLGLLASLMHLPPLAAEQNHTVYLPLVANDWDSPFGVQSGNRWIIQQSVFARANELGVKWIRLGFVGWRSIQPTQDGEYNWEAALDFEIDLVSARAANLTPIVIVLDSPHWATKTYYDAENQPYQTSCGAIHSDHFADFARFMQALVTRYGQPPYDVHFWELGNEPDIDPRLVDRDNGFGCWGDIDDPYYGGEHYGEMLKVVTPAIKAVDPAAQVVIGGLALDNPGIAAEGHGSPEKFFEGVLRAGAGNSFDIVAYHAYSSYADRTVDSDLTHHHWAAWGGATLGKARFLREVMARYGVDKPLSLNETGLLFRAEELDAEYFQAQADHIVRVLARSMAADLHSFCWYTLNGPGWYNAGLLDQEQNPRPAYLAYQQFTRQVRMTQSAQQVADYGQAVEAYRFRRTGLLVDVLWSRAATEQTIAFPREKVIGVYDRDGAVVVPTIVDDRVVLTVGMSPLYIERSP